MFGYVRPCVPELKVMDNELYRAAYCGLCRTMGKSTGCMSKMTLNYDFVFLALLQMAVSDEEVKVKKRRCIVHPFKKRPMIEPNESLRYSAKTSVILTRLKLKDNINDSHGFARLKAKIAGCVSIFLKKTDKNLKELECKVWDSINELTTYEKENVDSIDKVANTFGTLLGTLASYNLDGGNKRIVYEIGYHLGKLIYVLDAIDDLKSDIKTGSFNVIKNAFGNELTEDTKNILKCAMTYELEKMSRCVELLDFSRCNDVERIIKNITYIGLTDEIERVLNPNKKAKRKA